MVGPPEPEHRPQGVQPDLSIQPTFDAETGQVKATVHNAGTGVARGAGYVIAAEGYRTNGFIAHGVIRPNEMFEITTDIFGSHGLLGPDEAAYGVLVACRDRGGDYHVWTHDERHKEWRGRGKTDAGTDSHFRELFPAIDFDNVPAADSSSEGPA